MFSELVVKRLIFAGLIIIAVFVTTKFSLAAPPICLDPKGHLVWPGQSANAIPMRSINTTDTLANSPISVGASVVTVANSLNVAGDLSATGNVTGAKLCLGADCKTAWSQVTGSSFWQQTPTNANNISNSNSGNVGVGTTNPQFKLDVQGTFRVVDSSGTERIVIRDSAPTTQAPNQRNQAQVKSAYAQTAVPDRWVELFGGAAYFRKVGQNSDVFLQVGDANSNFGAIRAKGQKPTFALYDETGKLMGTLWYSKQKNSLFSQYYGGTNAPLTEFEITGSGFKFWKNGNLLYEVSDE